MAQIFKRNSLTMKRLFSTSTHKLRPEVCIVGGGPAGARADARRDRPGGARDARDDAAGRA